MLVTNLDVVSQNEISKRLGLDEMIHSARKNFHNGIRIKSYPIRKKELRLLLGKFGPKVLNFIITEQIDMDNSENIGTGIRIGFAGIGYHCRSSCKLGIFLASSYNDAYNQ